MKQNETRDVLQASTGIEHWAIGLLDAMLVALCIDNRDDRALGKLIAPK